jgi:hypothetical protein
MDFSTALYGQLQGLSNWTPHQGFLARRIEASPCGDSTVGVVEQAVRAKIGIDPDCDYDWSSLPAAKPGAATIDWAAILAFIEQLLPIILPLLTPAS